MSKKHVLSKLKETLPLIYTSGVFDSIATELGIEEIPLRGRQIYLLERLAPKVAFLTPQEGDAYIKTAIGEWLKDNQARLIPA